MHADLVALLRCPGCRGTLTLKAFHRDAFDRISQGLLSSDCGLDFAISDGVPRLVLDPDRRLPPEFVRTYPEFASMQPEETRVKDSTAHVADAQWNLYEFSRFDWGTLDLDTRVKYFSRYVGQPLEELRGRWVVDAGCGSGTLSAALAASGLLVIAFDYSDIVVRAEQHRREFAKDGVVHYVMADVLHPPLAPGFFDLVYSDGVIHLTPDPHEAFVRLAALVKPEGRLVVTVSRKDKKGIYRLHHTAVEAIRAVMVRLPLAFGRAMSFVAAAALTAGERISRGLRGNPDATREIAVSQRAFGLWHSFLQPHLHYMEGAQLRGWFQSEGFLQVRDCTIPALSATGCATTGLLAPALQSQHSPRPPGE